jgi:FtsP/CotA-like multicopper oxidase with cupredoxin domain
MSFFIRGSLILLMTASGALAIPQSSHADDLPIVQTHENRQPAGVLTEGTLMLQLRAARGVWRPEKENGPALTIEAFGERNGSLMAPAPLIRVPEGTSIVASVRNDLDVDLRVNGLCEHNDAPCAPLDVPAGSSRDVVFRTGRPGTYVYWGDTFGVVSMEKRFGSDTQLSGAFIVDPKDATVEPDRVFVITEWSSLNRDQVRSVLAKDDTLLAALALHPKATTLINGLSWPDTERLAYRVGDTVRWRIVNASPEAHPLHLHGFYFDVDSLGDGTRDTPYPDGQKPRVVTQRLPVGHTAAITWRPERAGNWLFHCHFMEHVGPFLRLGPPKSSEHSAHAGHDDNAAGMAGMVLGITVTGGEHGTLDDPLETALAPTPRKLTLAMRTAPNRFGKEPAYGFVVTRDVQPSGAVSTNVTGPSSPDDVRAPGPTLVLKRDEPVEITLVNELPEATAIHWHGMELESYYDGVHGFGGMGNQRTPMIEPGSSFVVRFTPPRTGTFMYHTHVHDYRQLTAGLYGPMLVVDPKASYDATTDHTLVIARDGVGPMPVPVLNGSPKPQLEWRAGMKHRLRFVNITRHDTAIVTLSTADGPVTWRPLTKDGAPVPPRECVTKPSEFTIAIGETFDFEYEAPATPQMLRISVKDAEGRWQFEGIAAIK